MREIFKGTPASPLLVTPTQQLYRTRIRNGVKLGEGVERPEGGLDRPGPNFAGQYIIVQWGCGSPCIMMAMVDSMTGRIYNLPNSEDLHLSDFGGRPWLPVVEFRVDSRLMIFRPCPNDGPVFDHYFVWKDNLWKHPAHQVKIVTVTKATHLRLC